jgi:hypothetical protein
VAPVVEASRVLAFVREGRLAVLLEPIVPVGEMVVRIRDRLDAGQERAAVVVVAVGLRRGR